MGESIQEAIKLHETRQRKRRLHSYNISFKMNEDESSMLQAVLDNGRFSSVADYIFACVRRDYDIIASEMNDGR